MMARSKVVPPEFFSSAFNCPHCGVYAKQQWFRHVYGTEQVLGTGTSFIIDGFFISKCEHCRDATVWTQNGIIYPLKSSAPESHPDMPDEARRVFEEARLVLEYSPRAAAALLRLCADQLCDVLGAKGNNLYQKIGSLVELGLPGKVQQALDSIRGFGNDALHPPGEILEEDDRETALLLFDLLNLIVEKTISGLSHFSIKS